MFIGGTMRKKVFSISLFLLCTFAFIGCQKTPDTLVVIPKDAEQMLEEATNAMPNEDVIASFKDSIFAPETYEYEFTDQDNKLKIEIDAYISLPDEQSIPIVRVVPADFDEAVVKRIFENLCNGYSMYDMNQRLSKSEIEEQILVWKQLRQSPDYIKTDESEAEIDEWIKRLEQEYQTAPDNKQTVLVNGNLYPIPIKDTRGNILTTRMGIDARGENGNRQLSFNVSNNAGLNNSLANRLFESMEDTPATHVGALIRFTDNIVFENGWEWSKVERIADINVIPDIAQEKLNTTPAQAQNMVDKILEQTDMSLSAMELYTDSEQSEYAYKLFYTRKVEGVACAITSASTEGKDMYAPSWAYEQLNALVTDEGIIEFFWISPVTVTDTIISSTQIMPFPEIIDIFQKMSIITYAPMTKYDNNTLTTLYVDKIELSLQRINEANTTNSGLLIPAWSFYGEIITTESDGGKSKLKTGSDCIFTINAIDGSVIDLILGY